MPKPQGFSTQAILRVKVASYLQGKLRLQSSEKLISVEEMKDQTVLKARIDILAMFWEGVLKIAHLWLQRSPTNKGEKHCYKAHTLLSPSLEIFDSWSGYKAVSIHSCFLSALFPCGIIV